LPDEVVSGIFGLAGALIGAAAAIYAAHWSVTRQRRAEIAEQFVGRVGAALSGIEYAEAVLAGSIRGDRGKVVQDARYLLGELRPILAVVRLRHPRRDAAERTFRHLEKAVEGVEIAVREPPGNLQAVEANRVNAEQALTRFSSG
jgi:hypothetical protein